MNRNKKTKRKKWIVTAAAVTAGVVAIVILVPAFSRGTSLPAAAVTRAATVETGTIQTTVVGSGNLTPSQTLTVKIPSGLSVRQVLVEEGDTVQAGDALAELDPAGLQNAILDAQDNLDEIDKQLDDAMDDKESKYITASIGGRVKQILVEEGGDIAETMQRDGALMVLSLDGYMKVDFAPAADLKKGDTVVVALPDGTEEEGEVSVLSDASCTVLLTDNGPEQGSRVTVFTEDGTEAGTGTLEINAPVEVMGGTGTVASVDVALNENVSVGETLVTLEEAATSREYELLKEKRAQQAEALRLLAGYSATNTVTAESAGVIGEVFVSGTDAADATQTASAAQQTVGVAAQAEYSVDGAINASAVSGGTEAGMDGWLLLDAAAGGASDPVAQAAQNGSAAGENATGEPTATVAPMVTELTGTTEIYINNPVTGNTPQSTVMPGTGYTGTIQWTPQATRFEQQTTYAAYVTLTAASGYRFAADATANVTGAQVSNVTVSGEAEVNTLTFTATFQPTAADQSQQSMQNQTQQTQQMQPQAAQTASESGIAGYSGSVASASASAEEEGESDAELFTAAFTLLTGGATSLTVSIDELDILSIVEGQEATVTLDAIPDAELSGTVTKISSSGNQQTGVTTYPVTISIDNAAGYDLLSGMNATATIVSGVSENVLVIPIDALQEMGNEQFVYVAGAGEEDGAMGEQRAVTTGLSDGTYVEITSGLEEGEQVTYVETQSADEESTSGFPDGRVSMGGMPGMGGGMPAGGQEGMGGRPVG